MPEFALPTILLMFRSAGESFIFSLPAHRTTCSLNVGVIYRLTQAVPIKMTVWTHQKFSITTHLVIHYAPLKICFQKSSFCLTEDAFDKPTNILSPLRLFGRCQHLISRPKSAQTESKHRWISPILLCLRGMPDMLVSLRCTEDQDQLSPCGASPLSAFVPMHAFDRFFPCKSLLGWFQIEKQQTDREIIDANGVLTEHVNW